MPEIAGYATIRDGQACMNGSVVQSFSKELQLDENLKSLYKILGADYPKFYKMDLLCKLGFLTSEVLFSEIKLDESAFSRTAIFLANSTSSLQTDTDHQRSINSRENYVPSPSVFVYTLPNIVMGEICIRRKIKGENTFLIFDKFDADFIWLYADQLFKTNKPDYLVLGWIDLLDAGYDSFITLVAKESGLTGKWLFNIENLNKAYQNNLK